jgi:hypothetical protein
MRASREVGWCVAVLIGGSAFIAGRAASAHSVDDYPANGWQYTILSRVYYQAPNNWPNGLNARTNDAMASWNALSGSALHLDLSGNAPSDSWSCGTSYDFVTQLQLMNGGVAATSTCVTATSTVRIALDPDVSFHTGKPTPNPANQEDLQAVMTHELGHAHQAWIVCTNGGNGDPCPGAHFDAR